MKHFNVRVYGILIQNNQVLVSDEIIHGKRITKFPGGGLEFGEGTLEGLKREFKEEMDLRIEIVRHFYTTDFFVVSAFNSNSQVISIYYLVSSLDKMHFKTSEIAFNFESETEGSQSLRWLNISNISQEDFTFAIDKHVSHLIKNI